MSSTAETASAALTSGPMTGLQVSTVAVCLAINLVDGFDVLAISFVATTLTAEWDLTPDELGLLFSAGVAGMTLASIVIAPIADYIGRRRTILLCLAAITLGMLASAMSNSATQLALFRFLTGLGIGTLIPSINTMVGEFASEQRRELSVTIMQAGFPLGATLGGFAAFALLDEFGWRGVFWFGAALSAVMIPCAWRLLPESPDFLLSRQPPGALTQLNGILARMQRPQMDRLPTRPAATASPARLLVHPTHRPHVLALSGAFFFLMAAFYFVASWTPKLLTDAGLSTDAGISGGVLLNLAGVSGGILLGWLAHRVGGRRLTAWYLCLAVVSMGAFTLIESLNLMILGGAIIGFFVIGSMMGLYSIAPGLYPAAIRSAATGIAVGMGRFGAVLGPIVTGVLLSQGWEASQLYLLFAAPLIVAAGAVFWLARRPLASAL